MDTTRVWRYMPDVTPPWVRADFSHLPPEAALVVFVDDEDEEFTFNGSTFKVHPGVTALELPESGQHWTGLSAQDLANAAEKSLGQWGVAAVPAVVLQSLQHAKAPAREEGMTALQSLMDQVKERWEASNTSWATKVHQGRQTTARKFAADGLKPPAPTKEEATAEAWLAKRGLLS